MMALARERENVISLGRGDPDLHTRPDIVEGGLARFADAAGAGMAGSDEGPVRGLLPLREGIAGRYAREKGVEVDPATEIAITNGAQEGLFLAMLALVDPGDRVACQDPRYSSYDQAIGTAGGDIVPVPTGGDRPFELGSDELRRHARGCTLLVFVNPSNPTGACVGPRGVRDLARAAGDLGLVVVSDEIYEDVVFRDEPFLSLLSADGARGRSVVLSGFSKGLRDDRLPGRLPDRSAGLHRRRRGHQEHDFGPVPGLLAVHRPRGPRGRTGSAPGGTWCGIAAAARR